MIKYMRSYDLQVKGMRMVLIHMTWWQSFNEMPLVSIHVDIMWCSNPWWLFQFRCLTKKWRTVYVACPIITQALIHWKDLCWLSFSFLVFNFGHVLRVLLWLLVRDPSPLGCHIYNQKKDVFAYAKWCSLKSNIYLV